MPGRHWGGQVSPLSELGPRVARDPGAFHRPWGRPGPPPCSAQPLRPGLALPGHRQTV